MREPSHRQAHPHEPRPRPPAAAHESPHADCPPASAYRSNPPPSPGPHQSFAPVAGVEIHHQARGLLELFAAPGPLQPRSHCYGSRSEPLCGCRPHSPPRGLPQTGCRSPIRELPLPAQLPLAHHHIVLPRDHPAPPPTPRHARCGHIRARAHPRPTLVHVTFSPARSPLASSRLRPPKSTQRSLLGAPAAVSSEHPLCAVRLSPPPRLHTRAPAATPKPFARSSSDSRV